MVQNHRIKEVTLLVDLIKATTVPAFWDGQSKDIRPVLKGNIPDFLESSVSIRGEALVTYYVVCPA